MKLGEYICLALTEIFHNKVRTFLTLIGIIIGIAAVIIIVFVVQGAEEYVMGEIEKIAPVDIMMVNGRYNSKTQRVMGQLTMDDLSYIDKKVGNKIRAMAPRYWYNDKLRYKGLEQDCDLIPTTPSFQDIYDLKLAKGRFLNQLDIDEFNQVIVLGYETAEKLFPGDNPLNKRVNLLGISFRVIGVLPKDYESPLVPVSVNNNRAFIPLSVIERYGGFKNKFTLMIRVKGRALLPMLINRVQELLDARYGLASNGESRFVIRDFVSGLEEIEIIKMVLMILLSGVASITLLVAGIGVMNIMLVIVTERTKEIGLRKALGATRKDILAQFMIESIILCLLGGGLGVVTGYIGSKFVLRFANRFISIQVSIPSWSVMISLIFTTAIGLFFGIYPASKAAKLDPIEALHYE